MVKKIIIVLLFLFSIQAFAGTTYHIAASGNDVNSGTIGSPWGTVFAITLRGASFFHFGDSILFNRGDAFEGALLDTLISAIGSQPIVIGAYGTGAKPILYGDLRGRTWIQEPGFPGLYKTYLGGHSELLSGFYQYVSGAWKNYDTTHYRSSNPTAWPSFDTLVAQGHCGLSVSGDTFFVHTVGNVTFPATKDSIRMFRYSNKIMSTLSNNYVVRDLDFRSIEIGFSAYGDSAQLHKLSTRNCRDSGLRFQDNATYGLMDSCVVDSSGDTGIYLVVANHCRVVHDTVTNVIDTVEGIKSGGIDNSAFGILDNYDANHFNGYNIVDSNYANNIKAAGLDFYFNWCDSMRHNSFYNIGSAASPGGSRVTVSYNLFVGKASGISGANLSYEGHDTTTFTYNQIYNVSGYGFYASVDDSTKAKDSVALGARIIVKHNLISFASPSQNFEDFGYQWTGSWTTPGVIADSNAFYGTGGRFVFQDVSYYTTASYYAASGYEQHSVLNTASMFLTSGDQQTKTVTGALTNPFIVTTYDASGNLSSGTTVKYAASLIPGGASGYSNSPSTATTSSNGQASSTFTLGTLNGTYQDTASAPAFAFSPVTFTAYGTAALAYTIAVSSGNAQSGSVSTKLSNPLVVLVTDQNSNPVPNDTVTVALTAYPANTSIVNPLSATQIITDANGLAPVNLALGKHAGLYNIGFSQTGLSTLTMTATATRSGAKIPIKSF